MPGIFEDVRHGLLQMKDPQGRAGVISPARPFFCRRERRNRSPGRGIGEMYGE